MVLVGAELRPVFQPGRPLRRHPQVPEALMQPSLARAQLLLEQSRYDLAERELRDALAADPDHALAHALLAVCHLEQDQLDDATREAKAALGLEPDLAYASYVLGLVLHRR